MFVFDGEDRSYKPEPDCEFICGSCVQLFLMADQDELKRGYQKAIEKNCTCKARAIETFIIPEVKDNEQKRPDTRKLSDRKRGAGFLRGNQTRSRAMAVKKRIAKRKGNKKHPTLSGF